MDNHRLDSFISQVELIEIRFWKIFFIVFLLLDRFCFSFLTINKDGKLSFNFSWKDFENKLNYI